MENLHEGHRKRLKEKFLRNGLDGFEEHEILELVLFFGIQRVNTNGIAHQMISKYNNLAGVFNAPFEELKSFKGITDNAATLLKLIPQLLRAYSVELNDISIMDNMQNVADYFISEYIGVVEEEVKVCCLDNKLKIISCSTISKGTVSSAPVNVRKIVEAAFRSNSSVVMIAHNHPGGEAIPSAADISITRQLIRTLSKIDISLIDHIIIGGSQAISMKNLGYFNILD